MLHAFRHSNSVFGIQYSGTVVLACLQSARDICVRYWTLQPPPGRQSVPLPPCPSILCSLPRHMYPTSNDRRVARARPTPAACTLLTPQASYIIPQASDCEVESRNGLGSGGLSTLDTRHSMTVGRDHWPRRWDAGKYGDGRDAPTTVV